MVIELPKGGYVPLIRTAWNTETDLPARPPHTLAAEHPNCSRAFSVNVMFLNIESDTTFCPGPVR